MELLPLYLPFSISRGNEQLQKFDNIYFSYFYDVYFKHKNVCLDYFHAINMF